MVTDKLKYRMVKAGRDQVLLVREIIRERIDWMDKKGLHQWNDGEYLDFYSEDYFRRLCHNKWLILTRNSV